MFKRKEIKKGFGFNSNKILLKGKKGFYTKFEKEIQKTVKFLDLSGIGLTSLDLSPLRYCYDLEKIGLKENKLKKIDIAPLGNCYKLNKLVVVQLYTLNL